MMADPVYDGAAFSLEDMMKSATLVKLFAGTTPTRNLLHVNHLGVTSDIFHVRMDVPAEQTHRIDLQRYRFPLNDHSSALHLLSLLVADRNRASKRVFPRGESSLFVVRAWLTIGATFRSCNLFLSSQSGLTSTARSNWQ